MIWCASNKCFLGVSFKSIHWFIGYLANKQIHAHKQANTRLTRQLVNPVLLPERSQGTKQPKHPQHPQDPVPACWCDGDQDVHQRHKHQQAIQDVPAALQVNTFSKVQASSYNLTNTQIHQNYFSCICFHTQGRATPPYEWDQKMPELLMLPWSSSRPQRWQWRCNWTHWETLVPVQK